MALLVSLLFAGVAGGLSAVLVLIMLVSFVGGTVLLVKKRTRYGVYALAGAAIALLFLGLFQAQTEIETISKRRGPAATAGRAHSVTYRVLTSRCCITSTTMEGPSGTTQDTDPGMDRDDEARAFVYSRTVTLPTGSFAYISAQATEYAEWTRCQIRVDGEVKVENESRGGFSIVTCSGRL